ncbi:acyltransferase family protein [Mailhella sp.]
MSSQVEKNAPERHNNFNILRFVAAVFVIIGHMYHLVGTGPYVVYGQAVSTIGVKILFVLSGYFITVSYLSDTSRLHVLKYAVKRIFRIFPALIFVVVACMGGGVFFTELRMEDYFRSSALWSYLDNILMYPRYSLPGVFTNNPYPHAVNGSLWTLPIEMLMYICVPLFCAFHARYCNKLKRSGIILLFLIVTGLSYLLPALGIKRAVLYGTDWCGALAILPYYLIGCVYAHFRDYKHLLNLQLAVFLMFLLSCCHFTSTLTGFAFLLIFPYFILSFGYSENPFFARCFKKHDLSYGMYLWGFPVQQALVYCFGSALSYISYLLITVAIVMALSFISFRLVEKPAIELSKKIISKF